MMVPEVQKRVIQIIKQSTPNINTLLDPYVGAGTTITAAMRCGLNATGQDINPLAVLVSKAKTDFGWSNEALLKAFDIVVCSAKADRDNSIDVEFPNMSKWFQHNVSIELSKLRRAIKQQPQKVVRRVLWVALAETIRLTSNDRTSTYKLHARPVDEIEERHVSPFNVFETISRNYVLDLIEFKRILEVDNLIVNEQYSGQISITLSDTVQKIKNSSNNFDLIVTSPPYGDNLTTITYGQHAYLPLQWIDISDIDENIDRDFLRTTQEIDRRSIGGKLPSKNEINALVRNLGSQSKNLQKTFTLLESMPFDRLAKVVGFYRDFTNSLERILNSVNDNCFMVWTIGNRRVNKLEIPNDQILIDLLMTKGFEFIIGLDRTIHNKRMPHKNQIAQMMRSEKILIFGKS